MAWVLVDFSTKLWRLVLVCGTASFAISLMCLAEYLLISGHEFFTQFATWLLRHFCVRHLRWVVFEIRETSVWELISSWSASLNCFFRAQTPASGWGFVIQRKPSITSALNTYLGLVCSCLSNVPCVVWSALFLCNRGCSKFKERAIKNAAQGNASTAKYSSWCAILGSFKSGVL